MAVNDWFDDHPRTIALVYLVIIPLLLVVGGTYSIRKNRDQDRRDAALVARTQAEIRANCERSEALVTFMLQRQLIRERLKLPEAKASQTALADLIRRFDQIGDCPRHH